MVGQNILKIVFRYLPIVRLSRKLFKFDNEIFAHIIQESRFQSASFGCSVHAFYFLGNICTIHYIVRLSLKKHDICTMHWVRQEFKEQFT